MVRLLEKEVYVEQKLELTISKLRRFFLIQGNREDIIVIYDNDAYVGIVTYQSFLYSSKNGIDDCIVREKYIYEPDDENLWEKLAQQIRAMNGQNAVLPIFNNAGDLVYFAYDKKYDKEFEKNVTFFLQQWESNIELLKEFLQESIGIQGVKIYFLNEISYCFYKTMRACSFSVEVVGDDWKQFYPSASDRLDGITRNRIFNIYAEGASAVIEQDNNALYHSAYKSFWSGLTWGLMREYKYWYREMLYEYFRSLGSAYYRVDIPIKDIKTVDEEYRSKHRGCLPNCWDNKNDLDYEQRIKVYGKSITEEEWTALESTKIEDEIVVSGDVIAKKVFGTEGKRIILIGECIIGGANVPLDVESLPYCIYEELKNKGIKCQIVAYAISALGINSYADLCAQISIKKSDIILDFLRTPEKAISGLYGKENTLDLAPVYAKRQEDWFYDQPIHTNYKGNQELAKAVAEFILPETEREVEDGYLQVGERKLSLKEREMLDDYIVKVREKRSIPRDKKVGAIVMNCNPMTNGHKYLIETVRNKVDYLYIFVVEENRSAFSFETRFRMVEEVTKQMENVIVVPSGEFVLSYQTFSAYFEKEWMQDVKLDASGDVQIFCQHIAPALGITERFVGEEPTDSVTRQYNEEMKRMLPYYGMTLTEIPRIQKDEKWISASRVRKHYENSEFDKVKELIPEEVFEILTEKQ